MLTNITYKYKLKPNKEQARLFEQWLGTCRFLYNMGMDIKKDTYRKRQKGISKNELMKQLTEAKKESEWLNAPHSQVLQNVLDRLERSYDNFFKHRAKYPKWAKKNKYKSFTFKQGVKLHPNTLRFSFPKIGKVRFFKDRYNENMTIKTATIIKEADGWYVSITGNVSKQPLAESKNKIGIDLGLTNFLVTSDGEYFDAPKYLRKTEKKLKQLQRVVSRKKKGSNNRKKAVKQLAKAHKKVSEQRKDFLHKLSTKLIRENQSVSLENLNIRGMVKNHKLAKSINDAGWGMFKNMLRYKSQWYGRQYIEVSPRNTSKICNVCGNVNDDMDLSVREWTCSVCRTKHNRDGNAAINIKNRGEGFASILVGENVSPVIVDRRFSLNQEPHTL
jgi:putative transposase